MLAEDVTRSVPDPIGLLKACSLEIRVQLVLFWGIIVPVGIIIFPAAVIAACLSIAGNFAAEISAGLGWIGKWIGEQFWPMFALSGIACASAATLQIAKSNRRPVESGLQRRLRPPVGPAGVALTNIVESLWSSLPAARRRPPNIFWFPNFNVLARTEEGRASQSIQLSSTLWDRTVRGDPVANGILVHELAHLVYRDGRRLQPLEAVTTAARKITYLVSACVLTTAVASGMAYAVWSRMALGEFLWQAASVICSSALVLLVPALALLTVRRLAAFITALIEVRADVSAGIWTGGIDKFGDALAKDETIKGTSIDDLRHSLISPSLTHLSNSERIKLLKDDERIATPKLRYFALSLLLAFVLPINPYTPLFAGGSLDYLIMAAVVTALHFATFGMILVGANSRLGALSWEAAGKLALFLCAALCLPQVNMYGIGYLLTNFTAALSITGGFGAERTTMASVLHDIAVTFHDLWTKLRDGSGGFGFPLAVASSTISLRAMSLLERQRRRNAATSSKTWFWCVPACVGGIVALASTYDPWRAPDFSPFDLGNLWFSVTKSAVWLRLCAPDIAATILLASGTAGYFALEWFRGNRRL